MLLTMKLLLTALNVDPQAVIFVFDSTDRDRLEEAVAELRHLLEIPSLAQLPFLIVANKQAQSDELIFPTSTLPAFRMLTRPSATEQGSAHQ
jgi:hypothetical protein